MHRENSEKLLVDVGRGIFVELTIAEARRFCHEKLYHLRLQIQSLGDWEVDIRTHIDVVFVNLEGLKKTLHVATQTSGD